MTIQFPSSGILLVQPRGALNANIINAAPIVFTSDQGSASVAGSWLGIRIVNPVSPPTLLQNVKVLYAGGADSAGSNSCPQPGFNPNNAAIRILGIPNAQFIANSEIAFSAGHGIDRGWQQNSPQDFMASNTFTGVAGCKQTTPAPVTGACPTNPPCP